MLSFYLVSLVPNLRSKVNILPTKLEKKTLKEKLHEEQLKPPGQWIKDSRKNIHK